MTLGTQQRQFARNVAKFLKWVTEHPDYDCTIGEVYRPDIMQERYVDSGKSKVQHSKHQDRLAIDINLFIDGVYQTDSEAYRSCGDYWKSLDPENVWGGDWKSFHDGNHFQYGV